MSRYVQWDLLLLIGSMLGMSHALINSGLAAIFAQGRYMATWKREFKLPWRKAGPPNHHDDKEDSDQ